LGHNSGDRGRIGWGRGCGSCGGFTKDFEHDCAASWALAFDSLTSIFHGFLKAIHDFLLGFAFDTISFGHKCSTALRFMRWTVQSAYLTTSAKATWKRPAQVSERAVIEKNH
jgi:hypothetical protein